MRKNTIFRFAREWFTGALVTKWIHFRKILISPHETLSMVPLFDRRHRIYEEEVPEVIEGLKLRLFKLLEEKTEPEKAELGFRVLYRLMSDKPGRPKYPEFSWEFLDYFLEYHRDKLRAAEPP